MYNQVITTQKDQEPPLILNTNTALVSSFYVGRPFKLSIPALNDPTSYTLLSNPFGNSMGLTNEGLLSGTSFQHGIYNIPFEVSNAIGSTRYSISLNVMKFPYYVPSSDIYYGDGPNYDVSDVNNWWQDSVFTVPAGQLPTTLSNVIITKNILGNSAHINLSANNMTIVNNSTLDDLNSESLYGGLVYINSLNSIQGQIYAGQWYVANTANIGYFEQNIYAKVINSYESFGGNSYVTIAHNFLNGSGLGAGGVGEVNGTAYFYGGNCDGTVYGDAHFYNGASLINGNTVTGTAYFSGGVCGGNVNGNAIFYNGSSTLPGIVLCDPNGSPGGDNGRVDFYPGSDEGSGVIITGDAYFHSPKTYNGLNTIYGNIYYV